MMLSVFESRDFDLIKKVFLDKDIQERITSDTSKINAENLPRDESYRYIVAMVDNKIIGVNVFCDKGEYLICHFNVIKKYRFRYAKRFAEECLKTKITKPLFAITPTCYNEVINFCKNIGFVVVGCHEDCFKKNNVNYKQVITRYS